MITGTLALIMILLPEISNLQARQTTSPSVEEHVRDVTKGLPADSGLRQELLQGARGNGLRYPWMDEMRKQGIKRVAVCIDIRFDHKGRPTRMKLSRTEYFEQYENGAPISDIKRLEIARTSGLEEKLHAIALDRAKRGFWTDVPRPTPRPFVGGTRVEFLDDEWLPVPSSPMYYVGGVADRIKEVLATRSEQQHYNGMPYRWHPSNRSLKPDVVVRA